MVIGFTPGGQPDITARLAAERSPSKAPPRRTLIKNGVVLTFDPKHRRGIVVLASTADQSVTWTTSSAIVVSSPWPVWTTVPPGSVSSRVRIDFVQDEFVFRKLA